MEAPLLPAGIADELRERLTLLLGSLAAVLDDRKEPPSPRQRERLENAQRGARRLLELAEAAQRERAARLEAEAASRAKDEFIAMISHELRTPLGAILIWTQLLRNEKLDEAATNRALGMVERSTRTLVQVIDDLLDVSRAISGKLNLDLRPVDLGAVMDAAVASSEIAAEGKGIRIEYSADRSLGPVWGDAGRLQQVVGNLLSNAIKFTHEGGRVEVRLEDAGNHARITVRDTGVGISPAFLPYIFERFRQADTTITRAQKGLGLGLAIARHLVELHGGSIEAESAGEGQGSTFTATLPWKRPGTESETQVLQPRSTDAEAHRESALQGLRVLVLDDDDDAREGLAVLIEQWGGRVTAVGSAADALRALEEVKPHVLLSDIAMPVEDGFTFIRRVRSLPAERGGQIPAAALTAYASDEDRSRAMSAGYQDHLPKPVEPERLLALILSLARRARGLYPEA